MIHQVLGGFQGQGTDIEIHARETCLMGALLNQIMAKHTGKTTEEIKKIRNVIIYACAPSH